MKDKRTIFTAKIIKGTEDEFKEFNDFGPITITINKPSDILFLHTACLAHTCNNSMQNAEKILLAIANASATSIGPERAVELAVEEGKAAGFYFPDFYKPLAIAMLKHSIAKLQEEQ